MLVDRSLLEVEKQVEKNFEDMVDQGKLVETGKSVVEDRLVKHQSTVVVVEGLVGSKHCSVVPFENDLHWFPILLYRFFHTQETYRFYVVVMRRLLVHYEMDSSVNFLKVVVSQSTPT